MYGLAPIVFVATSTAIGVMVDIARTPVYLNRAGGALLGTVLGERMLFGLSRERFRAIVSLAIGALGVWFIAGPVG